MHAVVATAGAHGATVAEVVAAVVPTPSYTATVSTLQRLQSRGLLANRRVGRTTRYTTDSPAAAARRMHWLLAAAADRDRALAEFRTGLAPNDEPRLLGERRIPQGPGPPGGPAGIVKGATPELTSPWLVHHRVLVVAAATGTTPPPPNPPAFLTSGSARAGMCQVVYVSDVARLLDRSAVRGGST